MGQSTQRYTLPNGEEHLCGAFPISILEQDNAYKAWYTENYETYKLPPGNYNWSANLMNARVEIFLGTWCGDSRYWVPRFIKLWDSLGLGRDQLELVALSNEEGKRLQSPKGQEKGKNIHRVPTFIISQNGVEMGRIVEYPVNDLFTDLSQIALSCPSFPNYRGATYLCRAIDQASVTSINTDFNKYYLELYPLVQSSGELQGLGNMYMALGKMLEAELTYHMNAEIYPRNTQVLNIFASCLLQLDLPLEAIAVYEKVLDIEPANEEAKAQMKALKKNNKLQK